jgi:hypothetical protein
MIETTHESEIETKSESGSESLRLLVDLSGCQRQSL